MYTYSLLKPRKNRKTTPRFLWVKKSGGKISFQKKYGSSKKKRKKNLRIVGPLVSNVAHCTLGWHSCSVHLGEKHSKIGGSGQVVGWVAVDDPISSEIPTTHSHPEWMDIF